ncbi:hypothetical protein [Lentzea atacamensis]|uniref:hypothetical protein n=1 Tax=Lentzea atacamensis TaxID=531938 RepID=UPI001473AE04|nr:hypothetical protein [Lentzea atacamensis]
MTWSQPLMRWVSSQSRNVVSRGSVSETLRSASRVPRVLRSRRGGSWLISCQM